ncbi:MAG: ROK family protein [Bacteroidota bacterium]
MTIDYNGPLCECGNKGCLEMYCSSTSLLNKANQLGKEGKLQLQIDLNKNLELEDIVRLADAGDKVASVLITEAAEYLAYGLTNLVNILNPDTIVISDEMCQLGDRWFNTVKENLLKKVFPHLANQLVITKSMVQGDHFLKGSGLMAIEHLLRNPLIVSNKPRK